MGLEPFGRRRQLLLCRSMGLFEAEHLPVLSKKQVELSSFLLPGEEVLAVTLAAFINSTTKTMQQRRQKNNF